VAQPAGIPCFDIDPFSTAYFDDPYPVQEAPGSGSRRLAFTLKLSTNAFWVGLPG
jgi:hypothetical protein